MDSKSGCEYFLNITKRNGRLMDLFETRHSLCGITWNDIINGIIKQHAKY